MRKVAWRFSAARLARARCRSTADRCRSRRPRRCLRRTEPQESLGMHTGLLLEMAAETFPDRIAVGSLADGLSYGELAARARAGGAWIASHGEGPLVFIGL